MDATITKELRYSKPCRSEKHLALRCFMWVDVVRMLSNNPKSEEKGGINRALNQKKDEKSG